MVKYDEVNIRKQKDILSKIIDFNIDIDNEYEAQKMIYEELSKLKINNNFDYLNISVYVKDDSKRNWKSSKGEKNYFVKIFFNEIEYAKTKYNVTNTEINFLYNLGSFLLWETNLLVDNEGNPMNQKLLCEKLSLTRAIVSDRIKSLERKKCLIRLYDGNCCYFIVNPYLMIKGQKISKGIPKIFEFMGYEPM